MKQEQQREGGAKKTNKKKTQEVGRKQTVSQKTKKKKNVKGDKSRGEGEQTEMSLQSAEATFKQIAGEKLSFLTVTA